MAAAAATAEARKLREEEARRVAEQAAAKVRQEAETAKAEQARKHAEYIRRIATEARALFGSDQAQFKVSGWEKPGDRRIYVGHGYDNNWVEYWHDGNSRVAPGTLKTIGCVVTQLAEHLGITKEEATAKIKGFCEGLIDPPGKASWKIEVNASNAPLAEGTLVDAYVLAAKNKDGSPRYGKKGRTDFYTFDLDGADSFYTAEKAMAKAPDYLGTIPHKHLAESLDQITLTTRKVRRAFPPKGGA